MRRLPESPGRPLSSTRDLDDEDHRHAEDAPVPRRRDDTHVMVDDGPTTTGRSSFSPTFARSTESASRPTFSSRHRMAWMLAHTPEYSQSVAHVARADVSVSRLQLDSPGVDSPRWRPTLSACHRHAELRHEPRYGDSNLFEVMGPERSSPARRYSHGSLSQSSALRFAMKDRAVEPEYLPCTNDSFQELLESNRTESENQGPVERPRRRGDESASDEGKSEVDSAETLLAAETKDEEPNVPKTSRYLREMDRRVILDRLNRGEKQATLAKEFNVSRAAISNLYKHRHDIMARADEDPFAKHPKKKARLKTRPHKQRVRSMSETDAAESNPPQRQESDRSDTHQCSVGPAAPESPVASSTLLIARSRALPFLLSMMSDQARSLDEFRRFAERAMWLLLEEAVATVPADIVPTAHDHETTTTFNSYVARSPSSAVSMEFGAIHATPLLDIFQLMEPHQPATTATVFTTHDSLTVDMTDGGLPPSLRGYNVFVLDVVAGSGEAVCATIEKLRRELDVDEASVTVVSLFTSSEVVAMVQCKYPLAKILTARIDSSITRRRIASTPVDLILHRMREVYAHRGRIDRRWW